MQSKENFSADFCLNFGLSNDSGGVHSVTAHAPSTLFIQSVSLRAVPWFKGTKKCNCNVEAWSDESPIKKRPAIALSKLMAIKKYLKPVKRRNRRRVSNVVEQSGFVFLSIESYSDVNCPSRWVIFCRFLPFQVLACPELVNSPDVPGEVPVGQ